MRRSIKSLLSLVAALAVAMVARPAAATVEAQLYADTYVVTSGSGASMRVYSVLDVYAKGNHVGDSIAGSVLGITSWPVVVRTNLGTATSDIFVQAGAAGNGWRPTDTTAPAWDSFIALGNRAQGTRAKVVNRAATEIDLGVDGAYASTGFSQMVQAGSNYINSGSDAGWYCTRGGNPHTLSAAENPFARVSLYNASWNATFSGLYRGSEVLLTKGRMQAGRTTESGVATLSGAAGASLEFHWMIGRFAIDITDRPGQTITLQVQFNMVGKHGTATDAGTIFTGSGTTPQFKLCRYFTYADITPTISAVSPSSGPLAGGTALTITGTNLSGATVSIGGVAATVTSTSATSVAVVSPASASEGGKTVTVTTLGGTATRLGGFTYIAPPSISGVTPSVGPLSGGTSIAISGSNLSGASVSVGGVLAVVTSTSATSVVAKTPVSATAGAKAVSVTTAFGTASAAGAFTYVAAPTVTSVTPSSGPQGGGTTITIAGTNLSGATVSIGGVAATVTSTSPTSVTAVTPASSTLGGRDLVVVTSGGSVARTGGFTYIVLAPTISAVTPGSGPQAGGTVITISGANLSGATVKVGGVAATVSATSATSVTARTPASTSAGAKDVAVTNAGGTATRTAAFTYIAAPTIRGVSPTSGPTTGGTTITIAGTNLSGATVTVGGVAATVTGTSATSVTALTPASGTPGAKDVAVATPGGTASKVGGFVYVAAPAITAVTPAIGPLAGGTGITITGTNLAGASVKIGGIAATVTANSATSVNARTPAHTVAGAKDIVVTTAGGSATRSAAFTYLGAPTIASVSPANGPVAGGTTITIAGTNLLGATVKVGGVTATVSATSLTSVTAVTPASATAGAKDVAVTTAVGTVTKTASFTYIGVPTITAVTPSTGPLAGGTTIVIAGTNLAGATVKIGGVSAIVTATAATSVTAKTPASATTGTRSLSVTTTGGTVTRTAGFTYVSSLTDGSGDGPGFAPRARAEDGLGGGADGSGAVVALARAPVESMPATLENCLAAIEWTGVVAMDCPSSACGAPVEGAWVQPMDAGVIDLDGNGVADLCQLRCGDLDMDGQVGEGDLAMLLTLIGQPPVLGIGDLDGDGVIGQGDAVELLLKAR